MTEPDIKETAKVVRGDPFASELGIEFSIVEEGRAVCRMELSERFRNFLGLVHGGAIFAVADAAFSAAANSSGTRAMAVSINIDFLSPPGDTPYLEAEAVRDARAGRLGHYTMVVRNSDSERIAVCESWAYHTSRPLTD